MTKVEITSKILQLFDELKKISRVEVGTALSKAVEPTSGDLETAKELGYTDIKHDLEKVCNNTLEAFLSVETTIRQHEAPFSMERIKRVGYHARHRFFRRKGGFSGEVAFVDNRRHKFLKDGSVSANALGIADIEKHLKSGVWEEISYIQGILDI